jgi:hypothetical protein
MHAASAIHHAQNMGWIEEGEVTMPREGLASQGYDDFLMAKLMKSLDAPGAHAGDAGSEGSDTSTGDGSGYE